MIHEWVGRTWHLKNFYCPKSLGTSWDAKNILKNFFYLAWFLRYSWVLNTHEYYNLTKFRQNRIKNRIFFLNKQLTLFFNYFKNPSLNFAQNFRKSLFNLVGSESGEKTKLFEIFAYISQLFVYKTCL